MAFAQQQPAALQGTQAASVQMPPRVPLVTTIQNRDDTLNKDAKLLNCFAELEPVSGDYFVQKRMGLEEETTVEVEFDLTPDGQGLYNWKGNIYSVFSGKLFKDGTLMEDLQAFGRRFIFEETIGGEWLLLNNGEKAFYTDGTTVTEIAEFLPVQAGNFIAGETYVIHTAGATDFVAIGAANNNVGTQFVATGAGERGFVGSAALGAVSMIAGVRYEIHAQGSTDFTLWGAASNTVGHRFTANSAGTGTGSVLIPNFPEEHVPGWGYLDGTIYVMDENCKIYGTATLEAGGIGGFDDPRLWDPLSVIVARNTPGAGVYLARHGAYIVALKENSTEFFYNAGNPTGSPLSTVKGALSNHGCIEAQSVRDIKESMFWVSINRTSAPRVVRLDDLKVTIISTPAEERLLRFAEFNNATVESWTLDHCGHRFYGLSLTDEGNMTIVYDLDQQLWYHWTDEAGDFWPIVDSTTGPSDQESFVQGYDNGIIYKCAADYIFPTDDGDIIPVDIFTPNFDGDTDRRKYLKSMFFVGDQVEGSTLQVRVSDDDYQTWSNYRDVDLGMKRPTLNDCGTFTKRAWNFHHEEPTRFRLKMVALAVDLGTL